MSTYPKFALSMPNTKPFSNNFKEYCIAMVSEKTNEDGDIMEESKNNISFFQAKSVKEFL